MTALAVTIYARFSREEGAITFATDLSKNGCRGACRGRDKFEALFLCRPANGSCVFDEIADEAILVVADIDLSLYALPTDTEGNVYGYRGATMQGVYKVVEVPGLQVAQLHRGRCVIEVDLYTLIGDAYRPEQTTRGYTGIVVVDFVCKGKLPLKEIQSNEAEGTCVLVPIHADVDTFHETIVNVEEERHAGTGTGICSCPTTCKMCDAHESLKIEDRRWLGTVYRREDVKKFRPWTKKLGAAGNRSWSDLTPGTRNCW